VGDEVTRRPVVTAAELDSMTPEQVDEVWRASIVTDPDALPPGYLDVIRRRAQARITRRETPAAS
jgi:hypothetical protein